MNEMSQGVEGVGRPLISDGLILGAFDFLQCRLAIERRYWMSLFAHVCHVSLPSNSHCSYRAKVCMELFLLVLCMYA